LKLSVDLADSFGNFIVDAGTSGGDEVLSANDAGDGGGRHAENAEKISMLVKISVRVEGFDQAAGVNANERNLFGETGDIGGFDPGKVTLF
jgi:hypothetical protein